MKAYIINNFFKIAMISANVNIIEYVAILVCNVKDKKKYADMKIEAIPMPKEVLDAVVYNISSIIANSTSFENPGVESMDKLFEIFKKIAENEKDDAPTNDVIFLSPIISAISENKINEDFYERFAKAITDIFETNFKIFTVDCYSSYIANSKLKALYERLARHLTVSENFKHGIKEAYCKKADTLCKKENIETVFKYSYTDTFNSWIGKQCTYKVIYRTTEAAHSRKNILSMLPSKGPTIIIFRTLNGKICGGYTPLQWEQDDQWKVDPNLQTFIFSMDMMTKYNIDKLSHKNAIYCAPSCGLWFGESLRCYFGHEDGTQANSFSYEEHQYYDNKITSQNFHGNDKKDFGVKDLEILEVSWSE